MKIEDYQAQAMRTLGKDGDMLLEGCMGLIGECGEVMDVVKKWRFQSPPGSPVPVDRLIEECGDALWYCAELSAGLGKNLGDIYHNAEHWYEAVRTVNEDAPIETMALRLSCVASLPMRDLFDSPVQSNSARRMQEAHAAANVVGLVTQIRDFLEFHCWSSLEEAMELNIGKLKVRYPDGFDPALTVCRGG